jgi:hypothetical protein
MAPEAEFGSVEVQLRGLPEEELLHTAIDPAVFLFMKYPVSGKIYYSPSQSLTRTNMLDLVPTGMAQISVGFFPWQPTGFDAPLFDGQIVGDVQTIQLDLSRLGGVSIQLPNAPERQAMGPASVELIDLEKGALFKQYSFRSAPYRIYGVPPGDYQVRVSEGYGKGGGPLSSSSLRVVAGRICKVPVHSFR